MANLKAIRVRIVSVRSTRQITSAMKMVAAAKLRKAQDKIVRLRPYVNKLQEILGGLSQSLADSEVENVYGRISEPEKVLVVVITSNRGLCGAFNTNVIKEARQLVAEKYAVQNKKGNLKLLTIGKKGYDYFRKQQVTLLGEQNSLLNNTSFDDIAQTAETLMNSFMAGEYDRIELVYNQFKNAAVQNLTTEQFLPIIPSGDEGTTRQAAPVDYIYEPTAEEIVKDLIPKSLKIQFYKAVLDSFVAENGARMTAMHKATDNASTMIKELTLQYNKARQASITNQILEVVSGAEALRG
ncbi:MAG: ATP synthase F1 subunit gamma [Bacteroidales bacterium]|jgi:F-type H+-transporting ATPase subunit gamma|nr:ATP synthase F1 subunit gamma [Bacteroidales bacterium]